MVVNYNKYPTCDMLLKSILAVLLLAFVAQAGVVDLDDSNFTSFLAQHPYTLVEFYAPWCGHCKALAPEYEKLGELAEGKQFAIAKVDATVAEKSAGGYEVEGYPTIKFIANGFPIDYKGGRNADDMLEWLESFFTSKIEALTEVQVKEKIGKEDFLLVQGASAEQLTTLEVANFVDEAVKYYSLADGEYRVTLHLKKDSKALDFTGELNVKDLTAWTIQNSLPVVVPLNSEGQTRAIFENEEKLPAFLLYRTEDFSSESFAKLESVCEANKAIFKCSYADSSSNLFNGVARYLKVTEPGESLLAYVMFGLKEGYRFPNPNEISSESVAQFLEDIKEGKVEKYIDTEKDKKDKEVKYVNVLKLTAENYNQTIADNRVVFVEYYSPNCGHCVRFAPEYEKLATKVKEEGLGFVVAAADLVAESEISQWVEVSGYPTLRLFIGGKSIDYSGERNHEAIIKFVTDATNSKIQSAASADEVTIPAVILSGVAENSDLHLLPALFNRHPTYLVPGADFKLEVRTKKGVQVYSGESSLDQIVAWLEETTEPIVVAVVDSKPTKRLSKALEGKAPLLVIARREQTVSGHVIDVLEKYCPGKDDIVCGYAAKQDQDYESFNEWLGDKQEDKSILVYIDTTEFKKTIYEGDLTTLTPEDLSAFIEQASKKAPVPEEAPADTEATPAPEATPEENTSSEEL